MSLSPIKVKGYRLVVSDAMPRRQDNIFSFQLWSSWQGYANYHRRDDPGSPSCGSLLSVSGLQNGSQTKSRPSLRMLRKAYPVEVLAVVHHSHF